MRSKSLGHCWTFDKGLSLYFSFKHLLKIVTQFDVERPWAKGRKICSTSAGLMTNMAAMFTHGETLYKSSSLQPVDQLP